MKALRILIPITAILTAIGIFGVYWYIHPTHLRYNDTFILGNTPEAIIERYGDFDKTGWDVDGNFSYAAYQIRENTPDLIMSYDNSLWYEMTFEDGVVTDVRLQKGWYGG